MTVMVEADKIKLDAIWIKTLSSHVKMKTRKQLASPATCCSKDVGVPFNVIYLLVYNLTVDVT